MALKPAELRDLPDQELQQKLEETKEELFNLRFQLATGQLDNYREIRTLRKDVARLKSMLRQREIDQLTGRKES